MVQRELLFDDRDKFGLIRSAVFPGLSRTKQSKLRRLLEVIFVGTTANGGQAEPRRHEDLAELVGCNDRTLRSYIAIAEQLELIHVHATYHAAGGGRGANAYTVNWERLAAANGAKSRPANFAGRPAKITRRPAKIAGPYKEQEVPSCKPNLNQEPTSSPGPASSEWGGLEEDLVRLGMDRAHEALEQARCRGASPQRVRALMDHFASRRPAWSVGALYFRITRDRPDLAVESGWPTPSPVSQVRQQAQQRAELQRAKRIVQERERLRQLEDRRREEHLEALCGAYLDGLSPAECDALAERELEPELLEIYRFRPHVVRMDLLEALARRHMERVPDDRENVRRRAADDQPARDGAGAAREVPPASQEPARGHSLVLRSG